MNKLSLFILGSVFLPSLLWAQPDGSSDNDPVRQIHYPRAFMQTDLHEKYRNLMEALGCDQNVFGNGILSEEFEQDMHRDEDYVVIDVQPDPNQVKNELRAFQEECVARLKSERRSIILKPAKESAIMMSLMGGAAGGLMLVLGPDSYGGSFSVFAAVFNSAFYLKSSVEAFYNLLWTPAHPLDSLEIEFAKNQCFIPHQIWGAITEKFMLARQNAFEQRNAMNFIQFALSLNVFKEPKKVEGQKDDIKRQLAEKIDDFFSGYEDMDEGQLALIKVNVKAFIEQLMRGDQRPRYLHLQGDGGIGKTHFARALVSWMNELLPDCVHFDEVTVTSPEELEGNSVRPGAFLTVLSNQCRSGKPGSVVFMDEANWMNEPSFEASAKRTFNGNEAKLSTAYFGNGSDGSGLKLDLPPMLVIVASNKEIKDDALASRFDLISFPKPKAETLESKAISLLENSEFVKNFGEFYSNNKESIKNRILEKIRSIKNFRALSSQMACILEILESKARIDNKNFDF